jgi:transposase
MQALTPQQRARRHRINGLALLVAEGYTVRAAGEALGVLLSTAKSMWAEIRRDLGEQAC